MKKITGRKERHMRDISETGSVTEVGRAKNDYVNKKWKSRYLFIYLFLPFQSNQRSKKDMKRTYHRNHGKQSVQRRESRAMLYSTEC